MFAMPEHVAHSRRRRLLSSIYAKSTLQNSAGLTAISKVLLDDRLIPRLRQSCQKIQSIEFYDIFAAVTLDFVTAYVFGLSNGSNLVENPEAGSKFFRDYKAKQRYQFWPQDLPIMTSILTKMSAKWLVIPRWVDQANADIESWIMEMCDKAETTLRRAEYQREKYEARAEDYPNVYAQLRNALFISSQTGKDQPTDAAIQSQRLEVASELLDHTLAGFDTSSITLVFLAWELSRPENVRWQESLREEISNLADKHDAKLVDALPVLHAILMETLRLHAAIPGNQPRFTPDRATVGAPGHEVSDLPTGVRVQAQAWSLHRNPDVFPEPHTWRPERWLASSYADVFAFHARYKEMSRWFWAFGSGGRMCVGSNLAIYDMKAIVVAIWSIFSTEVAFDEGMVHRGGYVAEPVGKDGMYLLLRARELKSK